MPTIVHYECRNPDHLRTGSRRGVGGLVTHHGSVGYCDGLTVDGAHRWVATGGVPIDSLQTRRVRSPQPALVGTTDLADETPVRMSLLPAD